MKCVTDITEPVGLLVDPRQPYLTVPCLSKVDAYLPSEKFFFF
jgi:hypothetical protein